MWNTIKRAVCWSLFALGVMWTQTGVIATADGISLANYTNMWEYNLITQDYLHYLLPNSIAINHVGNVIVGGEYRFIGNSRPGFLYTISSDGSYIGDTSTSAVYTTSVVGGDDDVYYYAYGYPLAGSYLYTLSTYDGENKHKIGEWQYTDNTVYCPPAIGFDGTLYYAKPDSGIVGINQSGLAVWQSEVAVFGAPVIDQDGVMYVASDSTITAFETDGAVKWTYKAGGLLGEVSLGDGCIYAGCDNRTVVSLWRNGSVKRIYSIGTRPSCPPAVDNDGTIYVGGKDGSLYALNGNGTVKWHAVLDSPEYETPIIAEDGVVFVASRTTIYAFNPDGSVYWNHPLPQEVTFMGSYDGSETNIALDENGILYCISSRVKSLMAFQTDSPGIKTTAPWPCYRGNNQRTGCLPSDFVVAAEEHEPEDFQLLSNYPNPFNPTTTISFALPERGKVRLAVYSVSGQKVATLVDDMLDAGTHNVVFDGTGLASGIFVYRLEAEGNMQTGKMLLMK